MSIGSKWGGGRQREELQGRRSAGQDVVSLSSQMAHFIAWQTTTTQSTTTGGARARLSEVEAVM